MTTPYAALLSIRKIEEQQAEAVLASVLREVESLETLLRRLTEARAAWLAGELGGAAETLTGLETVERMGEHRVIDAQRRAMAARDALLDRQRQRKVVEELHLNALAAAERIGARRPQMELDDLGRRSARGIAAGGSR
jgi:flagellar biosynthesis chaperone FliJ